MSSSANDYQINNLNNTIRSIIRYIVPVVYILGNIGNLISALIFSRKPWRKNVCVLYFKVCLFINSCYINCNILGSILNNTLYINPQNSNNVLCKLYFYANFHFITLLPSVLIFASIDRLLISSQNVDTRLYSSKRLAYFSISIGTVVSLVYNIHYLIKVNIQELYPSYFLCYFQLSNFYLIFVSYSLAIINLAVCITMTILCILAFKNVRRIRAVPREKRTHQIRSMTKKDFQLLRCLYAQDIIYIIFSVMITALNVYVTMTKDQPQTLLQAAIRNFLSGLLNFLFLIPYTSNFLVFITISKAFRHQLKRLIYKIIGKEPYRMREENQIQRDNVHPDVVVSTIELPG